MSKKQQEKDLQKKLEELKKQKQKTFEKADQLIEKLKNTHTQ
jgi:hypothetical protein